MVKDLQAELRNTKVVLARPPLAERCFEKMSVSASITPSMSPRVSPHPMSPTLERTRDLDDTPFDLGFSPPIKAPK